MEIYTGIIKKDFLKAEVEFNVELPEFCEDQKFQLVAVVNEEEHEIDDFALLFNNQEIIAHSVNGVVMYTGPIDPSNIETTTVAQLKIEKNEVEGFQDRKFKLKVL